MASLKEIRGRINSVTNTRKITSAMKMVSSAKLHKAQDAIVRFYPYLTKITNILDAYLDSCNNDKDVDLGSLTKVRKVERIGIVAFSSNTSLCGAFNINVQKKLTEVLNEYKALPRKNITLYLIGKKGYEAFLKKSFECVIKGDYFDIADKPDYDKINAITEELMKGFLSNTFDKVEVVYNKFKNSAIQNITRETLLPVTIQVNESKKTVADYIIEPNPKELSEALIPTVVRLQMYGALLNSYASEHGARTTAMQVATDNANELIDNLVLEYNRVRQGSITNEILDIVGGAEALR